MGVIGPHYIPSPSMYKLLTLTLLLLAASIPCSPTRRVRDNPHGHEEAPYSVIHKYEDFESRSYPPVSWVCTEGVLSSASDSDEMFHKLFGYISGESAGQQTIEMTVPVMNRMVETQAGEVTKRMSFC